MRFSHHRPFTMAFHALIGAGFLAATFLVRPFLPDNKNTDIDQICGRANQTVSSNSTQEESVLARISQNIFFSSQDQPELSVVSEGIPTIAWPFIISGVWCIVFSFGFLVLAKLPYKVTVLT